MFLLSVMSWTPTISFIPGKEGEKSLSKLIGEVTARAINYRDTKNDRNQRHLAATIFGPSASNQKQCFYHSIERQLRRVNSKKQNRARFEFFIHIFFSTIKGSKLCNKYVSSFIHICLFLHCHCVQGNWFSTKSHASVDRHSFYAGRQLATRLKGAKIVSRLCKNTFSLLWSVAIAFPACSNTILTSWRQQHSLLRPPDDLPFTELNRYCDDRNIRPLLLSNS